jgi:hypothetical protein
MKKNQSPIVQEITKISKVEESKILVPAPMNTVDDVPSVNNGIPPPPPRNL